MTKLSDFPEHVQRRLRAAMDASQPVSGVVAAPVATNFVPRPSTDEEKLNKTEKAYLEILRRTPGIDWLGIQNITVKMADDCRFTADFSYIKDGQLTLVDTKGGFAREDSYIKIKMAARIFTWARFIVASRVKGIWTEKEIKP